jgi:hypothetical protein
MAKIGNLDIYFSENDASLYRWLIELGKAGYNKNKLGRNCLEIGRLFEGNLTEAQDAMRIARMVKALYPKSWQDELNEWEADYPEEDG